MLATEDAVENTAVIMAGGLGTRLKSVSGDLPKPMVPINGRPMLEHIIERLSSDRFEQIYLCVNYGRTAIMDYFGDGSAFGLHIEYLVEEKRLGTAGGLSLLPAEAKGPIVVMNGDIVTATSFRSMLSYHTEAGALATMGLTEHVYNIPYGVVTVDDHMVTSIEEKPSHRVFVNAGIYVIDKSVIDYIPKDSYFDMTSLMTKLFAEGLTVSGYPLTRYWRDVGRPNDLKLVREEFSEVFEA